MNTKKKLYDSSIISIQTKITYEPEFSVESDSNVCVHSKITIYYSGGDEAYYPTKHLHLPLEFLQIQGNLQNWLRTVHSVQSPDEFLIFL